ncbi:MAG: hypothetical protein RBG13Loki_2411 [Promethearchaeota archaeon CR_4]|nr:MAG: hypothetical protein RBG13Loki_2411 [Candidatus Lokiarchaeota archaeon CR_4]
MMLFFLLDGLVNEAQGFLGSVFTFILQIVSFAGLFILIFGLFQGFVLECGTIASFSSAS